MIPTLEQVVAILDGLRAPRHKNRLAFGGLARESPQGVARSSLGLCPLGADTILIRESIWERQSTLPKPRKDQRKVVLSAERMTILREYKDQHYPKA